MKNGVAFKNQNLYLLIFTLTKHPLCDLGQCCHYIETSPLIYGANQWDGFYIMATLDWNKLILTTTFSIYYFFLSWRNSLSLSVQPRMQTGKLANNNHNFVFFWILIKLNFIPILICWKKILYLENFSAQNQQLTF